MPLIISVEFKNQKKKKVVWYINPDPGPWISPGKSLTGISWQSCVYVAHHFILLWLNHSALWQPAEIVVYHSVS